MGPRGTRFGALALIPAHRFPHGDSGLPWPLWSALQPLGSPVSAACPSHNVQPYFWLQKGVPAGGRGPGTRWGTWEEFMEFKYHNLWLLLKTVLFNIFCLIFMLPCTSWFGLRSDSRSTKIHQVSLGARIRPRTGSSVRLLAGRLRVHCGLCARDLGSYRDTGLSAQGAHPWLGDDTSTLEESKGKFGSRSSLAVVTDITDGAAYTTEVHAHS